MSIAVELELRNLKKEQEENINRLNEVIKETSRRYHKPDNLEISLKTLIGAIEVLKNEQTRLVNMQIKLSQNMTIHVNEIDEHINAKHIKESLDNSIKKIDKKTNELCAACDAKIETIEKINTFLQGKFLRVLMGVTVCLGGIGGLFYFFQFVGKMVETALKVY